MNNDLLLLSGNDIPIEEVHLLLHPPTIKEISYIGEEAFFGGCEFLKFNKNKLNTEDRNRLEDISNFEILMSIMREKNPSVEKAIAQATMVLALLFPTYDIQIDEANMLIRFKQDDNEFDLNKENYDYFVKTLNEVLCLGGGASDSDYNPSGNLASQIADKLRDRHHKLAEKNKSNQKVAILSRYISILAVGENKDMNSLLNYTIYQLFDEFKRFQLKLAWDIHIKAQLAGAKDLEEVDDWMDDIHSNVEGKPEF